MLAATVRVRFCFFLASIVATARPGSVWRHLGRSTTAGRISNCRRAAVVGPDLLLTSASSLSFLIRSSSSSSSFYWRHRLNLSEIASRRPSSSSHRLARSLSVARLRGLRFRSKHQYQPCTAPQPPSLPATASPPCTPLFLSARLLRVSGVLGVSEGGR
uniref:Secreted protein n=1 Tax=Opuntia streptacantha TaxID=393608 RepID=A0A7C8ZT39_OPUST